MHEADLSREVRLTVPACRDYALVASMALCGLGMTAGLDMDLLGDLRTVVCECVDCLTHQPMRPSELDVRARVEGGRLYVSFCAVGDIRAQAHEPLDLEVTRGVLETLMPQVRLRQEEGGVRGIECSMPV